MLAQHLPAPEREKSSFPAEVSCPAAQGDLEVDRLGASRIAHRSSGAWAPALDFPTLQLSALPLTHL